MERKKGGRRKCEVLRNTGDTRVQGELREGYEVKRAGRGKKEERTNGRGPKGTNLVHNVLM